MLPRFRVGWATLVARARSSLLHRETMNRMESLTLQGGGYMSPAHSGAARVRSVLGSAAMGLFIAVGGSGCMSSVPPTACTLIGYFSTVEIVLEGPDAAEAERIALCTELGCSVPVSEATPAPTAGPLFTLTELGGGRWRIEFHADAPEEATIRVLAGDGTELGRSTTQLEWRRVGGSKECGGPQEAGPIIVDVG